MTNDEKIEAIKAAMDGEIVGVLCLSTDSMRAMSVRITQACREHLGPDDWNTEGIWISFPKKGGAIRPVIRSVSMSLDRLYLDPMMHDAQQRLSDAQICIKPKETNDEGNDEQAERTGADGGEPSFL